MKNFYQYPLFCILFIVSLQAYSQHSVTGTVLDPNRNAVPFANVVLLQAKDSTTVYKGSVSNDDGSFLLDNVEENDYVLSISFVGFENYLKKIKVSGNENLRNIILKESESGLDEVTITAQRPTVSKLVDRLVFNVENTSLSSGNAFDILKRTPGVIVSQGNLLIKNQSAQVYINDRKVYLTSQELQQLLEGFSGENIKSVEVITNPPAKYDAEGGSILNIITSKNLSIGYKGSVNGSATAAVKPKYSLGTSQYYKTDWLNAFVSYNFNPRYDYKNDEVSINYFDQNGSIDSRWEDDFERNTHSISHNINTILDFTLSETQSLSVSANLQFKPTDNSDITGLTRIYDNNFQLDSLYTTRSTLNNNTDNVMLNASYLSQLNENGASLSLQANYINYNDSRDQSVRTRFLQPDMTLTGSNIFNTVASQNSDIYTGQADLSTTAGNYAIDTGLKYSGIDSNSKQDFFNGSSNFNGNLSDDFDYKENIFAAYLSTSRDWEKWNLKLGLRGEYTDVEGNSVSLGEVNTQQYFQLFPTAYLGFSQSENHYFGLEYSRRISRARFQSLNPFRYYINQYNFNVGNPNLQPSITNKVNFNYTYKSKLSFDLYWERTNDALVSLPFQNNEQHFLRTVYTNNLYNQQYSLDVSYYNYFKDWWFFSLYGSVFNMESNFIALESNNAEVKNDVLSTYIQLFNQFTLDKKGTFTADVSGSFLPDFISGSYSWEEPSYGVSVGLRKTMLSNRLVATLNFEDIFNTLNIPIRSNYLNQDNTLFAKPESRYVRFGLRYNFGNFKLKDNQRAIQADEAERLESPKVN